MIKRKEIVKVIRQYFEKQPPVSYGDADTILDTRHVQTVHAFLHVHKGFNTRSNGNTDKNGKGKRHGNPFGSNCKAG